MKDVTLGDTLWWLHVYGDDIVLRIGPAGSKYGQLDTTTTADTLLATLEPGELTRPIILVWNWREPGYVYASDEPLGWVHLNDAPDSLAQTGPAFFIVQNGAGQHAKP